MLAPTSVKVCHSGSGLVHALLWFLGSPRTCQTVSRRSEGKREGALLCRGFFLFIASLARTCAWTPNPWLFSQVPLVCGSRPAGDLRLGRSTVPEENTGGGRTLRTMFSQRSFFSYITPGQILCPALRCFRAVDLLGSFDGKRH